MQRQDDGLKNPPTWSPTDDTAHTYMNPASGYFEFEPWYDGITIPWTGETVYLLPWWLRSSPGYDYWTPPVRAHHNSGSLWNSIWYGPVHYGASPARGWFTAAYPDLYPYHPISSAHPYFSLDPWAMQQNNYWWP